MNKPQCGNGFIFKVELNKAFFEKVWPTKKENNENININGETNQSFTASSSGNYAVIVTANECSNMSDCVLINFTGTGNLSNTSKTLIKILDLMGRETNFKPNTPLIYVYDDGSTEKVFSVEY